MLVVKSRKSFRSSIEIRRRGSIDPPEPAHPGHIQISSQILNIHLCFALLSADLALGLLLDYRRLLGLVRSELLFDDGFLQDGEFLAIMWPAETVPEGRGCDGLCLKCRVEMRWTRFRCWTRVHLPGQEGSASIGKTCCTIGVRDSKWGLTS
jgi:hypothetical protein